MSYALIVWIVTHGVYVIKISVSECALAVARCQSLMDPNATMEIELDHRGSCEKITNASRLVNVCLGYIEKHKPQDAV